jgi:hypothetical protein
VRKSLGFKNTGDAEDDSSVRGETGEQQSEVPDNAEAIACAAASSLADIGTVMVELSSGADVCSADLFEANIVK